MLYFILQKLFVLTAVTLYHMYNFIDNKTSTGSARSTPSRYTSEGNKNLVEDAIKSRALDAENRKKRMLAAFDHASKSGLAGEDKIVNFDEFKRADG